MNELDSLRQEAETLKNAIRVSLIIKLIDYRWFFLFDQRNFPEKFLEKYSNFFGKFFSPPFELIKTKKINYQIKKSQPNLYNENSLIEKKTTTTSTTTYKLMSRIFTFIYLNIFF